jgi:transposase-like protein
MGIVANKNPKNHRKDRMMQNTVSAQSAKDLRNVIKINEAQIQEHLGEMVRSTVEETLNAMLDAEADQLCGAKRYERNAGRTNGRAPVITGGTFIPRPARSN